MEATNSITKTDQKPKSFTATISGDAVQKMIMQTLKDPIRAANFTSTMISVVNGSEALQKCEAPSIIAAALRGEALNLIYPVGEYSIVPYKNYKKGTIEAQFQIGWKGILRLASRSGQYKKIILKDVRAGEFKGYDPLSDEPIVEFIHDEDEREDLPIIGYFGRYILHNGFTNAIYWSHKKIINHADRYAKSFSKETYEKLLAGKLNDQEAFRLRQGSPWYDDPSSLAHQKMCIKTIAKQLFNDGIAPLSVELVSVLKEDEVEEQGGTFFSADDPRIVAANAPQNGEVEEAIDQTPAEPPKKKKEKDPLKGMMNAPVIDAETGEIIEGEQMSFTGK